MSHNLCLLSGYEAKLKFLKKKGLLYGLELAPLN